MKTVYNRFALFPFHCVDCHRFIWLEKYRKLEVYRPIPCAPAFQKKKVCSDCLKHYDIKGARKRMSTKVYLDIQDLPETLNGDYIAVKYEPYMPNRIWFEGCFKDKNRAQQTAEKCTNGFVVKIVRESDGTLDYQKENDSLKYALKTVQEDNKKLSDKCKNAKNNYEKLNDENFELRHQIIDLEDEVRSLVRTFRTIIAR